jgi:hypothetical protein
MTELVNHMRAPLGAAVVAPSTGFPSTCGLDASPLELDAGPPLELEASPLEPDEGSFELDEESFGPERSFEADEESLEPDEGSFELDEESFGPDEGSFELELAQAAAIEPTNPSKPRFRLRPNRMCVSGGELNAWT